METLKITSGDGPDYFVTATHQHNLELSDPTDRVAWSGTAGTYTDNKGGHYLTYHSGNSSHRESAYRITEHQAKTLKRLSDEGDREGLSMYIDGISLFAY